MAAPDQKLYVEKPQKVLAAAYDPTADPPQAGVCGCTVNPAFQEPHAHTAAVAWAPLAAGAMIVFDAVFSDRCLAVLTPDQFEALYGQGPPADQATPA